MVVHDGGGIMMQGPGNGMNAPFADMRTHLMACMIWDPSATPTTLREQFFNEFGHFAQLGCKGIEPFEQALGDAATSARTGKASPWVSCRIV